MVGSATTVDESYLQKFLEQANRGIPRLDWADHSTVLLHYVQFLEYFALFRMPELVKLHGQDAEAAIQSKVSSGANHILHWIAEQAKTTDAIISLPLITLEDIKKFMPIQEQAVNYSEIKDWLNAGFESFYEIDAKSESHLCFSYQDSDRMRGQAAEWLLKALHKIHGESQYDPNALINDVRVNSGRGNSFFVPAHRVSEYMSLPNPHFEALWRMDPEVEFRSFKLSEFKSVWHVLYSLADIQANLGRVFGSYDNFPFEQAVLRMRREEWLTKVEELCCLDRSKIADILDLLTYDESLGDKADTSLQPLFKLSDGSIIMSNFLVRSSNAESNLFTLWAKNNSKHYGTIAGKKESWWVEQKRPELERKGFLIKGPIVFRNRQGQAEGDIDLFIYDKTARIGLCCQLKWFLVPDRFRTDDLEAVMEGVRQAEESVTWLKADMARAQSTLSIKKKDFENAELLPLVISRDWMLNGIKWSEGVPIVSEVLFDKLLDLAPEANRLRSLWECAQQRTFLPVAGQDFSVRRMKLSFGQACLEFDRLEGLPGFQWSSNSIKFPAI